MNDLANNPFVIGVVIAGTLTQLASIIGAWLLRVAFLEGRAKDEKRREKQIVFNQWVIGCLARYGLTADQAPPSPNGD